MLSSPLANRSFISLTSIPLSLRSSSATPPTSWASSIEEPQQSRRLELSIENLPRKDSTENTFKRKIDNFMKRVMPVRDLTKVKKGLRMILLKRLRVGISQQMYLRIRMCLILWARLLQRIEN